MSCKVISISNQKGGVAKTTLAVTLGQELVKRGYRVLLIDSDPQGTLSYYLGIKVPDLQKFTLESLMMQVIQEQPLDVNSVLLHHESGIDFIPSNVNLWNVELLLTSIQFGRFEVLKTIVDSLRNSYDFIILDCMGAVGNLVHNAYMACDYLFIPVQPSMGCYIAMGNTIRFYLKVLKNKPSIKLLGIIFTIVRKVPAVESNKALLRKMLSDSNINCFKSEMPQSIYYDYCETQKKKPKEHQNCIDEIVDELLDTVGEKHMKEMEQTV